MGIDEHEGKAKNDILGDFAQETSGKKKEENEDALKGIYLFVSFDLSNSTLFKSRHKKLWPDFNTAFYDAVIKLFDMAGYATNTPNISKADMDEMQITRGFQLWKTVGDEVLLYYKIPSARALYNTIIHIEDKRKKIIDKTIDKALQNTSKEEEREVKQIYNQYFDLKTTVWIASCEGEANKSPTSQYPNLAYKALTHEEISHDNFDHLDFMGPDIDEGFRLAEYAEKGQMVISPKLVYLLWLLNEESIDQLNILNLNFKIVNYVTMKGIWENRLYPIIMFCQCDYKRGAEIDLWKSMFEYDAFDSSLLYANIAKDEDTFLQNSRFSIRNLKNIYKNIARRDEMLEMAKAFKEQENALKKADKRVVKKKPKFEFHISCLCYDEEQKKYWVTCHQEHGWSFGCTQVDQNKNYYDHVREEYQKKYNLDIFLDSNNTIVSFYSVDRNISITESVLGTVILVTDVKDIIGPKEASFRWVTYEEAKELEGKKLANYDEILDRAEKMIQEREKEKADARQC